jgi:hypothetical protein
VGKARDELSRARSARHGWIERGLYDPLGLLKGMLRTEVPPPPALNDPERPRQVRLAETTKHPQIRLEPGAQTRGPMRMPVTTSVGLLRVLDVRLKGSLPRSIAARRVRI